MTNEDENENSAAENSAKVLTENQRRFVEAYAATGNISEAARISEISRDYAYDLTRLPKYSKVQDAIEAAYADYQAMFKRQRHRVISFALVALDFRPSSLYDESGKLKPLSELDPEQEACLSEINIKEYEGGSSTRVKWVNKASILQLLGKWSGFNGTPDKPDDSETEEQIDEKLFKMYERLRRPGDDGLPVEDPEPS